MIASVTLLPALIGFVRERIEITRWRGLIAAGLGAVALLGLGLGFRPLLLGVPLALLVLLAGSVLPPLRGIVPRRAPRPLRRTLALALEPAGPGASMDRVARRCSTAVGPGRSHPFAAPQLPRRKQ